MTIYDRGKNGGLLSIFALGSFAVLALPCLAVGAGRGSVSSGGFHGSHPAGQQTNLRGFRTVALGAGRVGVSSGGFRVLHPARQQTHLHGFHRRGFFDGDGFFAGDGAVFTVEQPQTTVIVQPQQSVHKGRYIQPRWVEGGYGVQVLEPGYWTDNSK